MVILRRTIFIIIMTVVSISSWADISKVEVICPDQSLCSDFEAKIQGLLTNKKSREDIEKALEFILLDTSIDKLSYELYEIEGRQWLVKIFAVPKLRINDISYTVDNRDLDISSIASIVPIKINGFFDTDQVEESVALIKDQLTERGYPDASVTSKTNKAGAGLDILINIKAGEGIRVSSIEVKTDVKSVEANIHHAFEPLLFGTWNLAQSRDIIEALEKNYFEQGFWSADLNASLVKGKNQNSLVVDAILGNQYLFDFKGNNNASRADLLNAIKLSSTGLNLLQVDESIKESISKFYANFGLYDVQVVTRSKKTLDKKGINRLEFFVKIDEGIKTQLSKVNIDGNQFFSNDYFDGLIIEKCSVLVCRGYFDRKFFTEFSGEIRTQYLKNGFVMASVSSPDFKKDESGSVNVRYSIIENQRVELTAIDFPGLTPELKSQILGILKSKVGSPLDVTVIEEDMSNALNLLRDEGYFFARLTQLRNDKVVKYGRSLQTAQLTIPFELGRKTYFDGILVSGNISTKTSVIEREFDLKKGDLVTSREINRYRDRLTALGLFANINISPFLTQSSENNEYWLSLLVEVKERNFGLGEIAPGYRTDLGPKVSFQLAYNNLNGMNRTVSLKLQSNIRLDSSEFDSRRDAENHRRPEFSTELSFREPWLMPNLLGSKWDLEFSTSFKRQRFYSFDADIFRIGPKLSKQFGDHFIASVKYQFEDIRQFDATENKDGDRFQIGGITPSISLDYRDSPIIPTKGALFGLSWEFANPYFASQKKENLEINFNKLTSRNRFYYPLGNLVLALSISGGLQTNFANDLQKDANGNSVLGTDGSPLTVGYIPSIKVFRLDGIDNVRGFGDDEINRLPIGLDIGELRIQDTVTYVNYKFEPRYYFSDLVALGVFFDAAGLYVNHFSPLQVRTAVGLSAKLVTPVGSLDFDYGVKLHRQRYTSSQRESFGRFHLSIGSF
ncbi:MAG: hypothetical protein COW79_05395 [Bdellovibrionales bacterium CG22_combo_CG10-13_8_21_14_all_38_13]|nr:MAG: hypothetical protein COW79_05395 [Bdellovibrionales bacterium CG22_combo_CG10-13_8_21_14_all_38_13]